MTPLCSAGQPRLASRPIQHNHGTHSSLPRPRQMELQACTAAAGGSQLALGARLKLAPIREDRRAGQADRPLASQR